MCELKIWIAIRADLGMSPGKIAVQSGHACEKLAYFNAKNENFLIRNLMLKYMSGATVKVAVKVDSHNELKKVFGEALNSGIPAQLIMDAGRTEIEAGTWTVCAFGPALREELPPTLKRLQLY